MTTFRTYFPTTYWRANEPGNPVQLPRIDSADCVPDFAPSAYFIGSTFNDPAVERGPSESSWRISDALIVFLLVGVIAALAAGVV